MPKTAPAILAIVAAAALAALVALGRSPAPEDAPVAEAPRGGPAAEGELVVYYSPSCGCCTEWVRYLESRAFRVRTVAVDDLKRVKEEAGVPADLQACHTALLAGYAIEGHVPAEAVAKLLQERPEGVRGIAVPGMPLGSPGMAGELQGPLVVFSFGAGGAAPFMTLSP